MYGTERRKLIARCFFLGDWKVMLSLKLEIQDRRIEARVLVVVLLRGLG